MSSRLRRPTIGAAVEGVSDSSAAGALLYPLVTPTTPCANPSTSRVLVPPTMKNLPPLPRRMSLPLHPYESYVPGSYDYRTSATAIPTASSVHLQPGLRASASSVNMDPDKPGQVIVQQTYYVHHHHHHHHHHATPPQNPLQQRAQLGHPLTQQIAGSRLFRRYRPIILVLLFLPIPPLLSVLYVVVGHSLLRRASGASSSSMNTNKDNPWSPSLVSSANAAATGGTILSLPLFLALYVILPLPRPALTRARTPMDDFFEDDDEADRGVLACVVNGAAYVACAVMLICLGGASAALGVTCLTGGSVVPGEGREEIKTEKELSKDMLTSGRAAEAGIVGGAVLLGAVLVFVVVGVVGWWWWVSHRRRKGEGEGKI